MARKTITGLYERNGIWHVDKVVRGQRLQESTGTGNREEAEQYLIHRLEKLREEKVYGIRRIRSWREAATRYLVEYKDMPSIGLAATYLEQLDPYIGDLPITHVDDESLAPYIRDKLKPGRTSTGKVKPGVTPRTVNIALEKVIRVLNLCARKWRDEEKRPWLDTVPMISKLDEKRSRRTPYPLSWEEQSLLFSELPDHLRRMALYKVNCGSREQEVVKLRWDWEIPVPELDTSVFLIPSDFGGRDKGSGVKNGEERLVVLNTVPSRSSRGSVAGSDLGIPVRDARQERQGDTGSSDERFRLEEGAGQGGEEVPGTLPETGAEGIRLDPRARPEAHLRKKAPGSRCNRGRQAGPARPQERQHHQSLLSGGAGKTDR